MNIEDPNFVHRRIMVNNKTNQYSPKKRWDDGSFGSERKLLFDHVETALREH